MHRGFLAQKRSIPKMKSSAIVTTAESTSDPRQPRRFEKEKKYVLPEPYAAKTRCAP